MEKKYYYLGKDRKIPQGPYSLQELADMLMKRIVQPMTEVAAVGDTQWQPLGQLLMKNHIPVPTSELTESMDAMPPLPPVINPSTCPLCATPLQVTNGQLPVECPHCHHPFRPEPDTLWNNARMALRQYATFSGRATRKEYWSFTLYYFITAMVLMFACIFSAILAAGCENSARMVGIIGAVIFGILLILTMLGMIIPSWAVSVRRYHDCGFSGWWLLAYLILNVVTNAAQLAMAAHTAGSAIQTATELADKTASNDMAEMFLQKLEQQQAVSETMQASSWWYLIMIFSLLQTALGLFLFVLCFLDSQRGANKYGPSRKYPLG